MLNIEFIFSYVAIFGGAALIAFGVSRVIVNNLKRTARWDSRHKTAIQLGIAAAVVALAVWVLIMSPDAAAPPPSIDSRYNGAVADDELFEIRGSMTPPNAKIIVLVREGRNPRWRVQAPIETINDGRWSLRIHLGDSSGGIGEHFEVVAVASTNPWFIDLLRGRMLWIGETLACPPALSVSNIVTVWRRR
jgi:hypothetical protein